MFWLIPLRGTVVRQRKLVPASAATDREIISTPVLGCLSVPHFLLYAKQAAWWDVGRIVV